jgi:hypothetical protein
VRQKLPQTDESVRSNLAVEDVEGSCMEDDSSHRLPYSGRQIS